MSKTKKPNGGSEKPAKNQKSPTDIIKNKYVIVGKEDKFTKTTEYTTTYISFKSDLVDNYVKSKSEFGGGAIIKFSLLYRQKGDIDALLVEMKITYITPLVDYFSNPNILKNLNIIFLADGEPIECNNATAHNFGQGMTASMYDELGMVEISMDQFIQLVNAKEIEFRMSGDKGVFIEEKVDDIQLAKIKVNAINETMNLFIC